MKNDSCKIHFTDLYEIDPFIVTKKEGNLITQKKKKKLQKEKTTPRINNRTLAGIEVFIY